MGDRADLVVLCVAALALGSVLLLFVVLPDHPHPTPQFVVEFPVTAVDAGAQEGIVTERAVTTFSFEVPQGNLSRIEVTVTFADDLSASDPDILHLELVGPDGVARPPATVTANLLPTVRAGSTPPAYDAVERTLTVSVTVHEAPTQTVIAAEGSETTPEAAHRIAPGFAADGAGSWTLQAQVVAGDCPDPTLDPPRALACTSATPGGQDPGNPLRVLGFRSFHWSAVVQPA